MTLKPTQPTMDVFPWPTGQGFSGSTLWWNYVLSQDVAYRLDMLILIAHMDAAVRERLVRERDEKLMVAFALPDDLIAWLKGLQIDTLAELAQAVLARRNPGKST